MYGIGIGLDCKRPLPELLTLAKKAETKGFESGWAIHYHYYRDPFVVLAAIGSKTSLALGTAVTNVHERHPVALAMSAASLDELSRGRMTLGLGRGVEFILRQQLGIPYDDPAGYMREAVEVIRTYLSGGTVTLDGRFLKVRGVRRDFPQTRRVPIFLAAVGRRALQLAGEIGDGVVLNYCTTPGYAARALVEVRKKRLRSGLRGFGVASLIWAMPNVTDEALSQGRRTVADLLSFPGLGDSLFEFTGERPELLESIRQRYFVPEGRVDLEGAAELIGDRLLKSVVIMGGRRARSRLREYTEAGVTLPILVPMGEGQEDATLESFASR
ncbi:MAG: LLM class flavin-dependent oxidoreductase [Nitrososphaerota archaeon]|nr:LLM class flavin-dependent oxidoreductase [Nitrososphaerota archaeon]